MLFRFHMILVLAILIPGAAFGEWNYRCAVMDFESPEVCEMRALGLENVRQPDEEASLALHNFPPPDTRIDLREDASILRIIVKSDGAEFSGGEFQIRIDDNAAIDLTPDLFFSSETTLVADVDDDRAHRIAEEMLDGRYIIAGGSGTKGWDKYIYHFTLEGFPEVWEKFTGSKNYPLGD